VSEPAAEEAAGEPAGQGGEPDSSRGDSSATEDSGSALPGAAGQGVQPRFAEHPSLGRAARTVFLRALTLGTLIAVAFCAVVFMGPNPLDTEGALTSAALGAAVGLFAIGIPSGVECWLATWGEVKRARGFLLREVLGRCLAQLGEVELAREAWRESVEAAPDTAPGRAAAAALAALESDATADSPGDSIVDSPPGGPLPATSP
jgi:hypothetical protein